MKVSKQQRLPHHAAHVSPRPSAASEGHRDQSSLIAITFITVLALGMRLSLVAQSPFPLNDGGLFYSFISDLLNNSLKLPPYTAYNGGSIPFAYPPLAFYAVAVINLALRVSILDLLRFAPAAVSVASIPAFYLLAADLLGSRPQAALATLAFAMMPRTFDWLIMGGGITRSLGLVLALLVLRWTVALFGRGDNRSIPGIMLLGSLLVLSHPEATLHTVISACFLFLWLDRSRSGLWKAALIAGAVAALTAPWWAVVAARHGLGPFAAAAAAARQDSYGPLAGLLALIQFDFTDEPAVRFFAVLGLLGMAVKISRREYLLPVWFVLLHTLEPRGGPLFMMIPLALAAGFCINDVILAPHRAAAAHPASSKSASGATKAVDPWLVETLSRGAARLLLGFLTLYGCLAAYQVGLRILQESTLTANEARAFQWIGAHTPLDSKFVLITGGLPLRDPVSEWFPALTRRKSIATVFGLEWKQDVDFGELTSRYESIQACATEDAACLESWATAFGVSYDYVCVTLAAPGARSVLAESLDRSASYRLVYATPTLAIYEFR